MSHTRIGRVGGETRAVASFAVTADHCPQMLCRLLGLIAQQDRLVQRLTLVATRHRHRLAFEVWDLDDHRAGIIAEKMRAMAHVRTVRVRYR